MIKAVALVFFLGLTSPTRYEVLDNRIDNNIERQINLHKRVEAQRQRGIPETTVQQRYNKLLIELIQKDLDEMKSLKQ